MLIPADILRALTLSKHLGSIAPDASRFNLRTCKLQIFLGGERGMPSDLTRSVSFTQWSASHDETIFHHLCYIRIGWVTFVGGFNLQLQD